MRCRNDKGGVFFSTGNLVHRLHPWKLPLGTGITETPEMKFIRLFSSDSGRVFFF